MTLRLAALAMLDVILWGACGLSSAGAGWALAAHALLSAAGYVVWLRSGETIGYAAAIAGVLGPSGILATRPFRDSFARAMPTDEAIFGARTARAGQRGAGLAAARMLDGRVHHAGPETLGSLIAILRHGDVPARRRALETVVRSFEPSLSPLIALALTDRDQTIRALAAAASSRVAQNLLLTRARLDAEVDLAEAPDAAATLAALLADHARADVLLSDSQRGHLREDAVALMPADDPARVPLMIEALWAAGDYAAIDALAGTIADDDHPDAARIAAWWRTASAA